MKNLKAISFDADDTLWDWHTAMRHALRCAIGEIEARVPEARGQLSIEKMIETRDEVAAELDGDATLAEIRLAGFARTLELLGCPNESFAEHVFELYMARRYGDIQLFDDVVPTLDALSRNYSLGILTNGNTDPERCGLPGRFQFTVYADDFDFQKPDVRLFEVTLKRAGCLPGEFLHVGDSLESDVQGANDAGIHSVWLNRHGTSNQTAVQPDFEISTLTELLEICA